MTGTPDPHGILSFAASLDTRPDKHRVLAALGKAFIAHKADLWPEGEAHATPQWITDNVEGIVATLERLYRRVGEDIEHPGAAKFLARMAWLPALIRDLDEGRVRLDG
jgi:hypothetical protein